MELFHMPVLLLLSNIYRIVFTFSVKKYPLLMPNVTVNEDDLYACTVVKIVPAKTFYIVGFEPNAKMDVIHHMLLYGCTAARSDLIWDCGEMSNSANSNLNKSNPCIAGTHVIYAWARNAPPLNLPPDVGFEIGEGTKIKYLVMQVHYATKLPPSYRDTTGINITFTEAVQNKLAGVLLLASGGVIPANSLTMMDIDCRIQENTMIWPFAYRTHTHGLGKVVSGYHVTFDERDEDTWTLLGKRNPLTPQMFYPTNSSKPIRQNDVIAARCTMESHRDTDTIVGPTNKDEMCNFYLLYYVDGGKPLDTSYCIKEGPPYYGWNMSRENFKHVPEFDSQHL